MKLQLSLNYKAPDFKIKYTDKLFFIGSCFTEQICHFFAKTYFNVLQNPSGIIFDTKSLNYSLQSYISNKPISLQDLFLFNDIYSSWQHHSCFDNINAQEIIENINKENNQAHNFLKETNYIFITIGSAFSYWLKDKEHFVANCHKYPQPHFDKKLIKVAEIINDFQNSLTPLFNFNKNIKIIFTISPVRHVRDGVIENNRSKANVLEAVHSLTELYPNQIFYLPAYEMMIDILRDYRFYDIDLVHPNYLATEIIFNELVSILLDETAIQFLQEATAIHTSLKHKPLHPETQQHKKFVENLKQKIIEFEKKYKLKLI